MAGEWIKMDKTLRDKPEVQVLAELLAVAPPTVVGYLHLFWSKADDHARHGVVTLCHAKTVDDWVGVVGFADALSRIGWLRIDPVKQLISIPKWDRHNGNSAKIRALAAERQRRARARHASRTERDGGVTVPSQKAVTREEKRRSTSPPLPPAGGSGGPEAQKVNGHVNGQREAREAPMAKLRDALVPKVPRAWWASEATAKAAGIALGIGDGRMGESRDEFHQRIRDAIAERKAPRDEVQ